jgi:DNA-binding NtrC family response regulator
MVRQPRMSRPGAEALPCLDGFLAGGPTTVLIVDDEWLIRELMIDLLTEEGFGALAAADADAALAILDKRRIDVLFTDIDLGPGPDGIALARAARQIRPEIPVIYASGGRSTLAGDDAASGSMFISKPYRPEMVCAAIRRMLVRAP